MPGEFLIFGATLVGVAMFHRRALPIAVLGLCAVIAFKWSTAAFANGPGLAGLAAHFGHEWVILANLFLLLVGFELLAAHFESSGLPKALPNFLPDDWTGAFVLLAIVFVLSGFLDNMPLIALALAQGGYDWGVLAYAVGFGGSMLWFGSSAGVAISSMFPEARSTGRWLREGWPVAVAYVAGFAALVATLGWQPG